MSILPSCLSVAIVLFVVVGGKSSDENEDVLKDVLREQMNLIKHCMSTRCYGSGDQGHDHFKAGKHQVAFFAYPSKNLQNIPAKTRIIFDTSPQNVGGAYNPKDGIFTVPVDGVYAFHWTTLVHPGKQFYTILKVNDTSRASNHAYAVNTRDWLPASQSYVGQLRKGDKVWLSTYGSVGQYMYSGSWSTFSGYLL